MPAWIWRDVRVFFLFFTWVWSDHMACGPGSPELSKSYMDMASKLFAFTFTYLLTRHAPDT